MKKLELSQKKIISEIDEMKSIVKEQRSYFDVELLKLRDLALKKV